MTLTRTKISTVVVRRNLSSRSASGALPQNDLTGKWTVEFGRQTQEMPGIVVRPVKSLIGDFIEIARNKAAT